MAPCIYYSGIGLLSRVTPPLLRVDSKNVPNVYDSVSNRIAVYDQSQKLETHLVRHASEISLQESSLLARLNQTLQRNPQAFV